MYKFITIICFVICLHSVYGKTPDFIQKCPAGDAQCMIKSINSIIMNNYGGNAEAGLKELDPFFLGNVSNKDDPSKPVSIDITFFNAVIVGGKNAKAVKVKGFGENPEGKHRLLFRSPVISLLGDYKMNGKVLILPIQGEGKANLTMLKPEIKIEIESEAKTMNEQIYMDVKSTKLDLNCERFYMHFENLFNGDKELGDNLNVFINENWREIYSELKGAITKSLNQPAFEIIKQVFATTPYAELVAF